MMDEAARAYTPSVHTDETYEYSRQNIDKGALVIIIKCQSSKSKDKYWIVSIAGLSKFLYYCNKVNYTNYIQTIKCSPRS